MAIQPANKYEEDELCPNCGEFVPYLHDETGFCYLCSGIDPTRRCSVCNNLMDIEYKGSKCNSCRYTEWLEINADKIDRVMVVHNCTPVKAKQIVVESNRPICLSCKKPIKRGQAGQHFFCRTKPECRKASNVYAYHKARGKSHTDAVKKAIEAAFILKLTGGIGG